ncbi:MAG: hypothetical protein P4L22_06950 [Candidatus Babeliales bacterium]|nr:hypothetical protein [Candidatus Babeliales bacterium]
MIYFLSLLISTISLISISIVIPYTTQPQNPDKHIGVIIPVIDEQEVALHIRVLKEFFEFENLFYHLDIFIEIQHEKINDNETKCMFPYGVSDEKIKYIFKLLKETAARFRRRKTF